MSMFFVTSQHVYAVLTGWWWDRYEHDGPPQDAALADGEDANSGSAYTDSPLPVY